MSGVRVRVRKRSESDAFAGTECELPAPDGKRRREWTAEHTAAVAAAVGVHGDGARVHVLYPDGDEEELAQGRQGWAIVSSLDPEAMLIVDPPVVEASAAHGPLGVPSPFFLDGRGDILPEGEANWRRIMALYLEEPCPVPRIMQQVTYMPMQRHTPNIYSVPMVSRVSTCSSVVSDHQTM